MNGKQLEKIIKEKADYIIHGLRRERDRPFSGLAYSPIEAVEALRDAVCSEIGKNEP